MARTLANVLSKEKITEFDGVFKACPVYCFESKIKDLIANVKITSVDNNMYNICFPQNLDQQDVDPKSLFTKETVKDPVSKLLCKHIQLVSRKADALILWTDMSSEGENICFEVIDNVKNKLPQPIDDYIFRAKYTSLSSKDILEAFENLVHKPNEYESLSVDALRTIDLKIESAFTGFLTTKLFERYPVIEKMCKSVVYDSCQTTALAMCVERAERVEKFVPEQYFTINILIKQSKTGFKTHELKWKRERVYDKNAAFTIFEEIKQEKRATVTDVDEHDEPLVKPLPLNTNKLLKVASTNFGMSPSETLKVAESLYLSGFISYHKTESTTYGSKFNYEEILAAHQLHSEWGKYALTLLEKGYEAQQQEQEAGEILPIIPVKSAERGKMNNYEWKIYQFVTKNFLASISKPAIVSVLEVTFNIGDELFSFSARNIKQKGFLEIAPWLNTIQEETLPTFTRMQEYLIDTKKIIDAKTTSLGYLTEAELITQMESHNICRNGMTSRPNVCCINNLIDNEYVKVNKKKNRALVPTKLGTTMIKAFVELDPELVSPKVRANIEQICEKITFGEIDSVKAVNHILKIFKQKYEHLVSNFDVVDKVFKSELITKLATTQDETLGKTESKDK